MLELLREDENCKIEMEKTRQELDDCNKDFTLTAVVKRKSDFHIFQ